MAEGWREGQGGPIATGAGSRIRHAEETKDAGGECLCVVFVCRGNGRERRKYEGDGARRAVRKGAENDEDGDRRRCVKRDGRWRTRRAARRKGDLVVSG